MLIRESAVGLSSPWENHFKMVKVLLSGDSELSVSNELNEPVEGTYNFYVISDNCEKLFALDKILRNNIKFGNVTLTITYLTKNGVASLRKDEAPITTDDWVTAFKGNVYFVGIEPLLIDRSAVVFAHEILDYYSDDLTDPCGYDHKIVAHLVQEVAKYVDDATYYICTETPRENKK